MSNIELIVLIAAIASITLAISAIWLSIMLYKMSDSSAQATKKAASGIDTKVKDIENISNKFYTDTLFIIKDMVSDMRSQFWQTQSTNNTHEQSFNHLLDKSNKQTDKKLSDIRVNFDTRIDTLLHEQKIVNSKVSDMSSSLQALTVKITQKPEYTRRSQVSDITVNNDVKQIAKYKPDSMAPSPVKSISKDTPENIIEATPKVLISNSVPRKNLRHQILQKLNTLLKSHENVSTEDLVKALQPTTQIPVSELLKELRGMKKDGLIVYEGISIKQTTSLNLSDALIKKINIMRTKKLDKIED